MLDYDETLSIIKQNTSYRVIGFDYSILKEFARTDRFNLHDHIIVATTKFLNGTLMTNDIEITKSGIVKTIW